MIFEMHYPAMPLAQYVDCLWYSDQQISYAHEKILPTGTLELIINFGGHFRLYDSDALTSSTLQTDSWLVGLQTAPLRNQPLSNTHMIAVRFKPGGAYPFFPQAAGDMHNQVVPLDLLWGSFAAELRERLYLAPHTAARFELLERLLLARLKPAHHDIEKDIVALTVSALCRTHGNLPIRLLSEQFGISQKHLAALFRRKVGLTPKTLARVYRFQHVLQLIDPHQSINWSTVALGAHYYDQAHFNHDFATFTGMTPAAYVQRRQAVFGATMQQGDGVHFVPTG